MSEPNTSRTNDSVLDELILSEFPYPIAANYQKLLETDGWEFRTRKCVEIFEYSVRIITLGVLSQYIIQDVHQVNDPELDRKLYASLKQASLGQWTEFLFLGLRAYRGRRKQFFMPELYDWYWDTSHKPHKARKGVRNPCVRLVKIRNDLAHRLAPEDEKTWEALGQETWRNLRTVLAQFSFLQHYDLVRIVGQREAEYEYERYTGQEITTHCSQLKGKTELRTGWFYLSRRDWSVLGLHPMLISWSEEEESQQTTAEHRDAAVFSRLLKEAVEYAATVVRRTEEMHDSELLAQFQALLYYNIEHIKMAHKRTLLSWTGLQRATEELTALHMGAMRGKYQRTLYLQRDEILRKFQEFLASEKGCFVLTGKSGVGKTNFVLSLVDEFHDQDNVCVLVYDAARLSLPASVGQMISQDLAKHLTLEGSTTQDLFTELDRRGEMAGKTMIVVFDAVNENIAHGKGLLQAIDRMVSEVRHPWLKVVITSRPQAWRELKRGIPLAEGCYYRETGSTDYWVDMQEFTVELQPFARSELQDAYRKYRRTYGLETEYEALRPPIRKTLQDPLILRLVSEIYRNQAIPEQLQVADIYNRYIRALVQTERLYEEDVLFLERELMPLMITTSSYDNKVTGSQVSMAETEDGRPLWELIHNDDLLSNHRQVNQSFVNLVDAEILVRQEEPFHDYEIGFKYERFYEHFGGRRLYALAAGERNRAENYGKLIINYTFLVGAVRSALVLELENERASVLSQLAAWDDRTIRSTVVAALCDYSQKQPEATALLINSMFKDEIQPDKRHTKGEPQSNKAHISKKKVALEVAYHIGMLSLLEQAATSSEETIRATASIYIYRLWEREPQSVIHILSNLAEQARRSWLALPNLKAIESLTIASLLIVSYHFETLGDLEELREIWRKAIDNILQIPLIRRGSRFERLFSSFAIRLVTNIAMPLMLGERKVEEASASPAASIALFFSLPSSQRQKLERLVESIESASPSNLRNQLGDLIGTIKENDQVTSFCVQALLFLHGTDDLKQSLQIMKQLLSEALRTRPDGIYATRVLAIMVALLLFSSQGDAEDFELVQNSLQRFLDETGGTSYLNTGQRVRTLHLSIYVAAYIRRFHRPPEPNLMVHYWDVATARQDLQFAKLLAYDTGHLAVSFGYIAVALNVARVALKCVEDHGLPMPIISEQLARMRLHFPDEVDDFLAEVSRDDLTKAVKVAQEGVHEQIWSDFLVMQSSMLAAQLARSGTLHKEASWIFRAALSCSSLQQWFTLLLKRVINLIYGADRLIIRDFS